MSKVQPSDLEQFERSVNCDCHHCTAACRAMPGMLAPGDIDRIAEYRGEEESDDFIPNHFVASEGAMVLTSQGNVCRIPTIVPKQKPNGECVFLDEEKKCSIHPVSPFGCRCFRVCDDDDQEAEEKSAACLNCISTNIDYILTHDWLAANGHVAIPLGIRRKLMEVIRENPEEEV